MSQYFKQFELAHYPEIDANVYILDKEKDIDGNEYYIVEVVSEDIRNDLQDVYQVNPCDLEKIQS